MAIKITTSKTDRNLFGCSKWWGFPDLPDSLEFPEVPVDEEYSDPLTFVCQIRCSDIADLDKENMLPHEGMLYFFAALDYFLGNLDAECQPGMGEWEAPYFKVLYSPSCDDLHTHVTVYDDGTPACLPAEQIDFSACPEGEEGHKLLGKPYLQEINELYPEYASLLQIDCDDDWDLSFYDCGMLCFLLQAADIKARHFQYTRCYLHSF